MNPNHNKSEVNFIGAIIKLLEAKIIVVLITLGFTLLAFIYTWQSKPTFSSNVLIEIGHFMKNDREIELIESPEDLIKNIKI